MKILFILKRNTTYGFKHACRRSAGLWNSNFILCTALNEISGIEACIVEVVDNNDIDREVAKFRPDVVIIEALWVVPEKFDILKKLHPKVRWYVHLHSDISFLALEGVATEWVLEYAKRKVVSIANSNRAYRALRSFLSKDELIYLPNVYREHPNRPLEPSEKKCISIACLGAIRPMKNPLLQAMAAIQFAKDLGKPLEFHVNGSRIEVGGLPVLKNLTKLFEGVPNAKLVLADWMEREDLIPYLQFMDLGMQVSMTETFNIMAADYVSAGIPIVVSKEVEWTSGCSKADAASVDSIVRKMHCARRNRWLIHWNQYLLRRNGKIALKQWSDFVRSSI